MIFRLEQENQRPHTDPPARPGGPAFAWPLIRPEVADQRSAAELAARLAAAAEASARRCLRGAAAGTKSGQTPAATASTRVRSPLATGVSDHHPSRPRRRAARGLKRSSGANCSYFVNWTSRDDRMEWLLDVHVAGRYHVAIDYTCPLADAGSTIELEFRQPARARSNRAGIRPCTPTRTRSAAARRKPDEGVSHAEARRNQLESGQAAHPARDRHPRQIGQRMSAACR